MALHYPDVVPVVSSWLSSSHLRIESFWIGAEWRHWARYELYMALEEALGSGCLVTHGTTDFWQDGGEEIDILVEPREADRNAIAIKLRCEKVNENEGSYEAFRDQLDEDMARIKGAGKVESTFEGARLLLIGFSGQPSVEDAEFKTQPQPEHFAAGEVHCWISQYGLPGEV
jgi:hypothetical protein